MAISGTADDKAIFRKASDPKNTQSTYVGKKSNPTPKRKSSSSEVSMCGNRNKSGIYKKR